MKLAEFLRWSMQYQHNMTDEAVRDLTQEQLHWVVPGSSANHIGFTLWHSVRTEDHAVQSVLQDKPTVWANGEYHERWSLDKVWQGTGMSIDAAHAVRLPPVDEWMNYQQSVWRATDAFLSGISDETLEHVHNAPTVGELPARQVLVLVMLHSHAHLGEISLLRVLQGLESGVVI